MQRCSRASGWRVGQLGQLGQLGKPGLGSGGSQTAYSLGMYIDPCGITSQADALRMPGCLLSRVMSPGPDHTSSLLSHCASYGLSRSSC